MGKPHPFCMRNNQCSKALVRALLTCVTYITQDLGERKVVLSHLVGKKVGTSSLKGLSSLSGRGTDGLAPRGPELPCLNNKTYQEGKYLHVGMAHRQRV